METTNQEAQAVIADGAAATATGVNQPAASQEPSVEELKSALESEKALREIAESEAINAKKDIVAIKTGKKRSEIDASTAAQVVTTSNAVGQNQVQTQQPNQPDLAAQLAEVQKNYAEIVRGLSARGGVMPTGGGGQAESPAPKPQGYFPESKRAILKQRGYSDEKIARIERTIQTGSAYGSRTAEDNGISKRQY